MKWYNKITRKDLNVFVLVIFLALTLTLDGCITRAPRYTPLKVVIIKELIKDEVPEVDGVFIYNPDIIKELYDKSEDLLSVVWEERGNIDQMIFSIRNVDLDGLNPEDYHLSVIEALTQKIIHSDSAKTEDVAKLELLLTDAFLLLATHLAGGKTDSETIDPKWKASKRNVRVDLDEFIDSTLKTNRIIEGLQKLTPKHREYENLKIALVRYRKISDAGGWENFSTELPKIELDMREHDIVLLRKRLAITQGKIEFVPEDEELFDQLLYEHVMLFQKRNGIAADGVVGKGTIEAMNIPVQDRIASIEANLERWRWLSDDLGDTYITVNIANFELQVIEDDKIVFTTNAIVGREFRETPVFSSTMTYLVLNPDWTIPPTILTKDIIPSQAKNPAYLSKKNMKVLKYDGTEVDPSTIEWDKAGSKGFPYVIQQAPGAYNALGQVKFMFPNKYNVYIHDTPDRNLFDRTNRSFSSGCVRINKPLELMALLLKNDPEWTPLTINKALDRGKTRTVRLPHPIRVHIVYLTTWASDEGVVYFRKDVYDRDQPLLAALKKGRPVKVQSSVTVRSSLLNSSDSPTSFIKFVIPLIATSDSNN